MFTAMNLCCKPDKWKEGVNAENLVVKPFEKQPCQLWYKVYYSIAQSWRGRKT